MIKAILYVIIIVCTIIIPAYIWNFIHRESYENFLLKSVSPITQKSRNSILEQRKATKRNLKF